MNKLLQHTFVLVTAGLLTTSTLAAPAAAQNRNKQMDGGFFAKFERSVNADLRAQGVDLLAQNDKETTDPQEISMSSDDVVYDLPFAGILPDHPLYPAKELRDAIWVFLTRDNIEKAELVLLLSDKKIAMAQQLTEKGKWNLAVETLEDAEDDFNKIIDSMKVSQKIGSEAPEGLKNKVILSNEKHLQVMEDILKSSPSGLQDDIEEAMQMNINNYNELKAL